MTPSRTPYPSDVSDDEWMFVAPYLTLLPEDAGQRTYSLREVFNGLRWIVRAGAPWRMMPNDLPRLQGGLSTSAALDRRWLLRGSG
jgi:transposase